MAQRSAEELLRANIEAFNVGDFEAFGAMLADDAIYDEPGTHRRFEGRAESVGAASGWKDTFSDVEGTIETITASGNTAVAEITWHGTHDGVFETPDGPIAPTGNQVTVRSCMIATAGDDGITETHHYFDLLTLLTQIGAVEAPTGEPATAD